MKNLCNRLLKHDRDNEGDFGYRAVLHFPIGLLMAVPVLGWGLIALFWFYEANEDLHTADEAWKDTYGAMAGYITGTILIILILWNL